MRSCATCKASRPLEGLLFSQQISRHLKVGILCLRIYIYCHESGLIAIATVGDVKVLILGGLHGQGQAALRLHESPDNDEGGYLWRMRSEDEAMLGAVKQVLAG